MKLRVFSFSKISTFQNCPYQYKLRYIDKLPELKNKYLRRGSLIHKALETLDLSSLSEEDFNSVKKFLDSDLGKSVFTKKAVNETRIYLDSTLKNTENRKDAIFMGFIDRVQINDGIVELIDFKTGSYKDLEYQDFTQLILYSLYILQKYDISAVKLRFIYIDSIKENTLVFERSSVETYKSILRQNIQEIESATEFPKKTSKLCEYCGFKNICNPY